MSVPHQSVLVVHDRDPAWKRIISQLADAGYAVATTDMILEAVPLIEEQSFGVCLISPSLLGADEVLIATQRGSGATVVIGVSSDTTSPEVDHLIEMGLWDCIDTGISQRLLLLRLERALLERHGQQRRVSDHTGPVEFTLLGLPSATRYCRTCYTIVQDRALGCGACEAKRPPKGWPRILDSKFPWLGYPMDGRFVIEQVIGRGGAGVVYRAVDNQLRRQLAVKVVEIQRELDDTKRASSIQQLKAEALATAKVRSPHVVEIWDVVGLDQNTTALIMDYIEGVTLSSYVRRLGPLDVRQALLITRQVALALAAAHAKRLVHRDIKPQNVMIELLPDGAPFASVLDFGIVHAIDQLSEISNVGTPMYAAPEQIQSRGIDERTDIYGLGGVLYFMLTGRPPYAGKDARTLCHAHLVSPIPQLEPSLISSPVVRIMTNLLLSRCLAKTPVKRYPGILTVIAVLDAILEKVASEACSNRSRASAEQAAPVEQMLEKYLGTPK